MALIFRKTAKGAVEVETRAHRLPPRMRSTLILVDGKRDVDDLKALLSEQADETLRFLSAHGFVESVGETVRPVPHASEMQAPKAPPPPPPPLPALATPPPPAPGKPSAAFLAARRAIVRLLNDQLGPPATSLAIRMERADTPDELRPLVTLGVQLVLAARGRVASAAFAARLPTF